jgi:hypothetical protein
MTWQPSPASRTLFTRPRRTESKQQSCCYTSGEAHPLPAVACRLGPAPFSGRLSFLIPPLLSSPTPSYPSSSSETWISQPRLAASCTTSGQPPNAPAGASAHQHTRCINFMSSEAPVEAVLPVFVSTLNRSSLQIRKSPTHMEDPESIIFDEWSGVPQTPEPLRPVYPGPRPIS